MTFWAKIIILQQLCLKQSKPEDDVRPDERELGRDGHRRRVDIVREVDEVVVVLGGGGALPQPALDLRVRDHLLLVHHGRDLGEPDCRLVHALHDLAMLK